MVRLERILYEKAVNTNLLGRARKIAKPRSWFTEENKVNNNTVVWPLQNLGSKLMEPFWERLASMEYNTIRSISKDQGVPLENFFALREEDWRRGVLAENMKRENLHPFVNMIHRWTRNRYFKVDKYQPGFEVPDHILEETHGEPFQKNYGYSSGIQELLFEYKKEMIPTSYMWRSKLVILDILLIHGLSNRENWNRLFYNEDYYHKEQEILDKEKEEQERQTDMTDPANQAKFRQWMEDSIKKFPGMYCVEGGQFDYDTFFTNCAILNGHMKPSETMSQDQIDQREKH